VTRRRADNRDERIIPTPRTDDHTLAVRGGGMPAADDAQQPTGIVGDASASAGQIRSGEDTRRRGWFWHWNSVVTQFAPIIGLKGVGLLNSYTVWTDRRENSPHRGFAFPSQQSEADFYGEDRNELITINKILVALDLIEIRKEMVPRTDAKGRRWKVPHNLYRVKDHGDEFNLTTDDVRRVVALADKDRAVYRYVRRIFSTKFSPIDRDNVWHDILAELRDDPTWQKLAARTAKDESRASARTKAGHASRRAASNVDPDAFSLPNSGDSATGEATVRNSSSDSTTGDTNDSGEPAETNAATTNNGSGGNPASVDASTNTGTATSVDPTSTTYYQSLTTTTTGGTGASFDRTERPKGDGSGPGTVPDDQRDKEATVRLFDEANGRESTVAARRQLSRIAGEFNALAESAGVNGWTLVGSAIEEAVASGSAFVAPKRIREILTRWDRDGVPGEYAGIAQCGDDGSRPVTRAVTGSPDASHRSVRTQAGASIFPVDLDPFEAWDAACAAMQGSLSASAIRQLRESVSISGYDAGTIFLRTASAGVAESIDGGWGDVIARKLGVVLRRPVRISIATPDDDDPGSGSLSQGSPVTGIGDQDSFPLLARSGSAGVRRYGASPTPQVPVFTLPECRMTSTQVWMSVLDELRGSSAIPKPEIDSWLRDSVLLGRGDDDALVVGVPHALAERRAARFLNAIETAAMHIVGFDCAIRIVRTSAWLAAQGATGTEG
jgi:hypothetical protein